MPFCLLRGTAIEASLKNQTRQYLTGNLTLPQPLAHIQDSDIEVGISSYPQATFESAHKHAKAKEYQYVLNGMTEYIDLNTQEVHRFGAGDFYVIYPETAYLQKIKQDTRILFFKYPTGNDKQPVSVDEQKMAWAAEPLRVQRLDLDASQNAPAPNSLKPAVAVAVFDEQNRLLLVKRRDSGYWAMPGGTMELTESIENCACREVQEETGINIKITGIIGTYSDPNTIIAYSDGEVRREFSVLLAASSLTNELAHDDESTDVVWANIKEIDAYAIVSAQRRRVVDALGWRREGTFSLR